MHDLRVTLVAPPMDYLTRLYGFRTRSGYRNQPPLGVGYVAAALRDDGFPVTLLDAAAEGWGDAEAVDRVLETRPDVVGVSAITYEAESAFTLLRGIRARSSARLVLGGAHANSDYPVIPEQCPILDVIVAGDGERSMVDVCRCTEDGKSLEGIPGILWRREDGTFSTFVEREVEPNLDALPPPAYDLYPHHLYRPLPHRQKRVPATCMITSRGCSYGKCTYCELSGLIRKTYRRHSPNRVVEEMRQVVAITGAREIYFQDDIFVTDPAWVESLCDLLQASDLDVLWSCESRFEGLTSTLLKRMHRAGCWRIYLGLESGNQDLLDGIQKGFTLEQAVGAVRNVREAGIEVVGLFMLGLPGETPEKGRRTIEFSLGLGLAHAIYSLTVPNPNTALYDICKDEGAIIRKYDYTYKGVSFLPKGYQSTQELADLHARAFRSFYLRPRFWWDCLKRIRTVEDVVYYVRGFFLLFRFIG